jgi:hypothetical protein
MGTHRAGRRRGADMAYEELLAECDRRGGVGFRATGDFDLIASPKDGLTPELHAAIREHKGKIACYLVSRATTCNGPALTSMTCPLLESEHEGSLRGREPEPVLRHVRGVRRNPYRNWSVLEAILSSPEGAALI